MHTDIQSILAVLRDESQEIEWDDAWDKLRFINASDRSELAVLHDALSDPSASVRAFSLKALARIGGDLDPLIPDVIQLLKDQDHDVRTEATKLLKRFGKRRDSIAVPALRQLAY